MPNFDSIDHLNFEAVAALIDDELTPAALHRAHNHLAQCPDCRREVAQQKAAAEAVREHNTDGCLRAPRSLVERLAHLDEPAPTSGSATTADSESRSGSDYRSDSATGPGLHPASRGASTSDAASAPDGASRAPRASQPSRRKWPISWNRPRGGLR